MKKFEITYNEGLHYNLKTEVVAKDQKDALVIFNMEHPLANEITKIEEV